MKNSCRGEKKAKVLNKLLDRKVSDQTETEKQRDRDPTIFFGSEQYRVAGGAVTNLCVCQHLQHIHCVFLESPKDQRQTPLSFCHLNTWGTF